MPYRPLVIYFHLVVPSSHPVLPWTLPAFLLVVLVLLLNEVLGRELGHGLRDDVEGVSARSYIILANVHVCAQKFLCQFLAE